MSDTPAKPSGQRLYYLDALRTFLMLQVALVHVTNIYSHGLNWFVSSPDHSWILTVTSALLSTFMMPGFFFIAGYFSYRGLMKRGAGAWVRERVDRILVPLIACMIVLSPLAIYAGVLSAREGVQGALDGGFSTDYSESLFKFGNHWNGHLWFLQAMFVHVLVMAFLASRGWLAKLLDVLNGALLSLKNKELIWLAIIVACVVWNTAVTGFFYILHVRLDFTGFLNGMLDVRAWASYFPYFFFGFMAARSPKIFENLMIVTWFRIAVALACTAIYVVAWPQNGFEAKLVKTAMRGAMAIALTGLALAFFRKYANAPRAWVSRLSDASFGIYLLHYPLVILAGVWFYKIGLPPLVEFALIGGGVFIICYWLTRYVILRVPVLAYLFSGIPIRRPAKPAPVKPTEA